MEAHSKAISQGKKSVLATVVALDGSSYRRPGVRMLLLEDGSMVGAVSGGCVEKEILRQAQTVFETDIPKVMIYDGRYRLGCEGVLYVLLEPFLPEEATVTAFWEAIGQRQPFVIRSYFQKAHGTSATYGSTLEWAHNSFPFRASYALPKEEQEFAQELSPCFQLVLIGAEHDAVQLCAMATVMGWEVTIVADPKEQKALADFPGASRFLQTLPEEFPLQFDDQTAVLLMTHSYAKDLQYLAALRNQRPQYLGVLGPVRRREKLFNELLDRFPDTSLEFIESVYGPAGLELGAETPQEIGLSVLAEILATAHQKKAISLREKTGSIHS